jgi:hypothetical protein
VENSLTRNCWKVIALGVTLSLAGVALHAQDEVQYQKRSNRYEGIKPKPVSGFDIELLSARVDFSDAVQPLAERFHARFFLERAAQVHIVVRELDYKYFYWLDKVVPQSPWRSGYGNVFDWPTRDVVRQLDGLRISDLGVVARLDREGPSAVEQVAPVVLYQTQFPANVTGYVFHFRLREDAKLKGAVYKAAGSQAVFAQDLGKQRGDRPFAFKWDLTSSPPSEGQYKLVLSGYMLSTNDPVSQVVQFYHKADIK